MNKEQEQETLLIPTMSGGWVTVTIPKSSLFSHPPIPEMYEDFSGCGSDCDGDGDCDCEDCADEEFNRREELGSSEDEPTGGGYCYYYYHRACRCLACDCCGRENREILRECDQKLLADYDDKELFYHIYCNAYYEPVFDIWLCHGCGEVHEYNGKPSICHERLKEDRCEPALIDKDEFIYGNCIHCGSSKYIDTICKIQDKTKCECDECMTLYSRFRNNKTKSARN